MKKLIKKSNFNKALLVLILVFLLIVGVVFGYSTAYFTAEVFNNPEPTSSVVTTGVMAVEFTDGPTVGLSGAVPGQSVTKTFSISNTGTLDTYYDVYLSDLINEFADKNDLVYTLTSNDGGKNIAETVVPSESSKIIENQRISVGETHYYTLKIEFKETGDNQDDNLNKRFATIVRVNEVKDPVISITSSALKVGDKVLYTAEGNEGTITKWVVIKAGPEPELVSEITSLNKFEISGREGYLKAVKLLNQEAASYGTNTSIVKATRHMGGNNTPSECTTHLQASCPNGNDLDEILVSTVMGLNAANINGALTDYWIATRYLVDPGTNNKYSVKFNSNAIEYSQLYELNGTESSASHAIRPIITLQASVNLESTQTANTYKVVV